MTWTGFLAISKSPGSIDPSIPSSAVYERAWGVRALHQLLLEHDLVPRFLHLVPGLPGEPQIMLGSADVMENLSSSCTGHTLVN